MKGNVKTVEYSPSLDEYVKELETIEGLVPEAVAKTDWMRAFDNEEYVQAVGLLDSVLAEEPDNVFARLVWIRAHLGARQLPTTALCAPLEEVSDLIDSDPLLIRFGKALFLNACIKLEASEQTRLAWSMVAKVLKLPQDETSEQKKILKNYALHIIEQEIHRAEVKRETQSYKAALHAKRDELKSSLKDIPASTQPDPVQASSLTAKDIAASAPQAQPSSNALPDGGTMKPAPGMLGRYSFISLALLLVAFGLWSYLNAPQPGQTNSTQAPIRLSVAKTAKLLPPKFKISANRPLDKKLETVGQRLEKLGLLEGDQKTTEQKSDTASEIDVAALNPEHAKHLSNPVSPADDELVALDGASETDSIPEYNPANINSNVTTSMESVGNNTRGEPIPQAALGAKLKVDPKGRIFGPASAQDPARQSAQPRALDGSPLRSYEVKQFTPPLLFKTIATTRVLSAPSILSSTLAELPENTPIHVSAQMGRWLELRSTGGRVGYIFSQDAIQTK